ncbi:MAG: antibiotic biosynthesis monooxygenase [Gammaproteobacteria bacterium]|nr:MAG: antibiotic biosynthesis monooxygenase [Gammaproteobacteria bacterium]
MSEIASTPKPPYYAVLFTALRTEGDKGYQSMAEKMSQLAAEQPGYLGAESARDGTDKDAIGITLSYWSSLESIQAWKQNTEHLFAQQKGKSTWYQQFKIRISKVERDYGFTSQ